MAVSAPRPGGLRIPALTAVGRPDPRRAVPAGASAVRPAALTATEERVAALAATGQTNRQVAQALFLSPKTVEANLARVYRKLGISSRAELGAVIARTQPPKPPS